MTLTGEGFVRSSRARWNGSDRPTEFLSATQLRVTLVPADVAATGTGEFAVYSPPPAGGTSGVVAVTLVNPPPTIASLSPDSVEAMVAGFVLTVTGSNFVPGTVIRWGNSTVPTTRVSATQLTANIASHLVSPGTVQITVVNPAPGGGVSEARVLRVVNPRPVVEAISPDSALNDSDALTLTVDGSRFAPGAAIHWGGNPLVTTVVSSGTRLRATVPAASLRTAGQVAVTVVNPAPGGGASNPQTFQIRAAPPHVETFSPASATEGSGAFTLTITGRNFTPQSRVRWNGAERTTAFVSATTLTAQVNAADVQTGGTAQVTVVNPAPSGTSVSAAFPILPAAAGITTQRTVALPNHDVAYDRTRNRIYASVPANAPERENTVTSIDPTTGAVIASVAVGSDPGALAISDNDRYLYVALRGAPAVVRVDLQTFTRDIQFSLGSGWSGALYAADLAVVPGAPGSVVVSLRNTCCSPAHEGVAIFDNGQPRANRTQGHTGSDLIAFTATGRLFGYNRGSTEFGFREIGISATGLQELWVQSGLVSGFNVTEIVGSGHLVFSNTGAVVDPARRSRVATISALGPVRPDVPNGRVHYYVSPSIRTYSTSGFSLLGTLSVPEAQGATRMIRWGADGLVLRRPNQIVIIRSPLVGG